VWGLIKDPVSPLFFRQNDVRLRGNGEGFRITGLQGIATGYRGPVGFCQGRASGQQCPVAISQGRSPGSGAPYVEFRAELSGIGLTLVGSPAISLRAGRLRRSDHPHSALLDEAILGAWGSARRSKVVYELRKGSRSPLAFSDKITSRRGCLPEGYPLLLQGRLLGRRLG
jgi:hypothetical protein